MHDTKPVGKHWILIGATGRIGRAVYSINKDYFVTFGRSSGSDHKIDFSLSKQVCDEVQRALDIDNCAGIVYLAGASEVEYCFKEPIDSRLVNVDFPVWLWGICNSANKFFFYASSEYVYSGDAPFLEGSSRRPKTAYGIQKYEAESKLLNISSRGLLIFRFGKGINTRSRSDNFFLEIFNKLSVGESIDVAIDQIFNPFDYYELAYLFPELINKNEFGIFNYGGPKPVSRFDFVMKFAESTNLPKKLNKINLNQMGCFSETRPCNLAMSTTKFTNHFGLALNDWEKIVIDSQSLFI
jgi:dTDP-4-dehydrorhamnose reductase